MLIGGGKERLASLLTPEFVAAAGLPADAAGQQAAVAAWHKRKTEIYTDLVAAGAVPPRPGIARIVGEALAAGWPVAVASTSAEARCGPRSSAPSAPSWRGRSGCSPGTSCRARSPPRTSTCSPSTGSGCPPADAVVIEDSRNGLLAATGAGLACLITVNDFTGDEDFSEAALVVSSLGDPGGERDRRPGQPHRREARRLDHPGRPASDRTPRKEREQRMPAADLGDVEAVVHTIATTAVENEKYFGDLDAVVGDGDFGYSMARGFELVLRAGTTSTGPTSARS